MGHLSRLGCLAWASCVIAAAAPDGGKAVLSRIPLRFEENRGQFAKAVRYMARSGGYDLQLTDGGAAFQMGDQRVELRMVHANPSPEVEALKPMDARTNYFVGARSQW